MPLFYQKEIDEFYEYLFQKIIVEHDKRPDTPFTREVFFRTFEEGMEYSPVKLNAKLEMIVREYGAPIEEIMDNMKAIWLDHFLNQDLSKNTQDSVGKTYEPSISNFNPNEDQDK